MPRAIEQLRLEGKIFDVGRDRVIGNLERQRRRRNGVVIARRIAQGGKNLIFARQTGTGCRECGIGDRQGEGQADGARGAQQPV